MDERPDEADDRVIPAGLFAAWGASQVELDQEDDPARRAALRRQRRRLALLMVVLMLVPTVVAVLNAR